MKRLLLTAAFGVALAAGEAQAATAFVRFGPPPPPPTREVVVVRPSPRHVWVAGCYRWNRNRYAWAPGYWAVPPRPRAVWVPGYWAHQPRGYVWIAGYWR
jgi:hypothetical protein